MREGLASKQTATFTVDKMGTKTFETFVGRGSPGLRKGNDNRENSMEGESAQREMESSRIQKKYEESLEECKKLKSENMELKIRIENLTS